MDFTSDGFKHRHFFDGFKKKRKLKKERDKDNLISCSECVKNNSNGCAVRWNSFISKLIWLYILFLSIHIADCYTNHPPRFLIDGQTEIVLRLKEGSETPAGSLIYKLRGIDPDGDPLTFGVREQLGNEILRIEKINFNEAYVYLKKELDRETRDEYALVLTLTDGRLGEGNFITQSLLILVEDVNDNEPIFKAYPPSISLPEDSPPGIILTVEATDADEGSYGQVVYSIEELEGDNDVFSIATINGKGVIRLVGELDYEKKFLYQLRVLAKDRSNNERVNTGTAAILVKVEDVEDQPPEFLIVSPVSRISEDAPITTSVVRVTAVDGDRGIDNKILYSITRGSQGVFDIDPNTGIISTTQKLDRESPMNSNGAYILEIMATEQSTIVPPPSVKTEITIIITDVNDEIPTFRSETYVAEVNENAPLNTPVTFLGNAKPEVYDHDQGNNGTFLMFLDGDSNVFEVSPSKGINEASFLIRVKDPSRLDFEKTTFMNFTLVAKETVPFNAKYSIVPVTVYIRDVNDNVPEFSHRVYEVSVPENSPVGTIVAQIEATDRDSGDFGTQGIRYTGLVGSIAELLSLDPGTGVITIRSDGPTWDRELMSKHYLTIEARDLLGSGNRNTAQLVINVEDVNDNPPLFLQMKYEARLIENQLEFESPLILEAHDKDMNGSKNSQIIYSLVAGDRYTNFTIDSVMGLLQPLTHIDFEELAEQQGKGRGAVGVRPIHLQARAQDLGTPPLFSDVLVTIYVIDMNDHAPVFEDSEYQRSIPEDLSPGTSVITVKAFDGDASSPNNDVYYRLVRGAKDKFVIDSETGVISVANGASLDPDKTDPKTTVYSLTVMALDGGIGADQLHAVVDVNITITDVNNKAPLFKDPGIIKIKENLKIGEYVYRVVAIDLDEKPILRYHIDPNSSEARREDGSVLKNSEADFVGLFELNPIDGMLRVKRTIDREQVETIRLAITCEDMAASKGPQLSYAFLTIVIEDENDNDPVFRKPFYKRSVTENSKKGIPVTNVVADDADRNRTITYTLEGDDSITQLLDLDKETGEIIVANKIDHEITPWLNFTVRATDSGVPPRFSFVDVFVQILDENDNNPYFVGEASNFTVREDAPVGTEVAVLDARDADSGDFGKVTYLLDRMSSHGKFQIDPETGSLYVADKLDRESISSYSLIVEAWDNYQFGFATGESRNAFKQIIVNLIDVNDELPVFERIDGCVNITEFHDVHDLVTLIRANDADDPNTPNGRIQFRITAGNGGQLFRLETIDFNTARIMTSGSLKGLFGNYTLEIEAQDMGVPSNQAVMALPICVSDFNDNAPRFISPKQNFTIRVPENTTVGSPILQVEAVDDDTGLNGAVRYRFKKDPIGSWRNFHIDEITGLVSLQLPLDRETHKLYELRIEAYDLGVPTPLSTDLDLTIYVKNVNDHQPQFLVDEIHVNFTEHEPPGVERRLLIETVDRDEDDDEDEPRAQVCYFIVGGNEKGHFSLEPLRHELSVEIELDREVMPTHDLIIQATEDCLHTPKNISVFNPLDDSLLKVNIFVNDINDHAPKFVKRVFTGGVTTESNFGTEFMNVKAIDLDEGKNAEVSYYQIGRTQMTLTVGMENIATQPFLVDRKTGAIRLNFDPQKEMKGYFDLMVLANDTSGLQDMARVFIYLLRADQRVRFVLRHQPKEVREKIDKFRDGLREVTGAIVNVDEYKIHENHDGSVDSTKTDLYLHFVNPKDNSVMMVDLVLRLIDKNIEKLDTLFKYLNVLDTQPAEPLAFKASEDNMATVSLISITIFLLLLLSVVLFLFVKQRSKYKRALKAATTTAFGPEQPDLGRITGRVPNTNMHSVEGSNPMWMKAYENEWYKEDDSLSQASERDSLDNNAVSDENIQITLNLKNKSSDGSEGNSENSTSTYSSTTNILPPDDGLKQQNDLNRSQYHQNLYQSMNKIPNPLMASKKLETTEL